MRSSLLLACLTLVMLAGEAEAREPEWNYTVGSDVRSVAISADGEYIAASSGSPDGRKVFLFDKDSSTPLWNYATGSYVQSVAISADGEHIVAGPYDNKTYLFDKDSSTPLWNYTTGDTVRSVAISADGEYIAAGGDGWVYLFDKDSSTPLWSYAIEDNVWSVAISADGEYIAAGSWNGKVYLFDKDSSTPLWNYTTGDWVRSMAISADGEYIAVGSWNGKVYLFDKDSGTPLWNYTAGGAVYSVAISADGEYITAARGRASDPRDNKVYLFDKDSGTPLWSYATGYEVWSVAISADGEYIVAGSWHKVYLFDKDSSTPLWSYTTGVWVNSVAISADGEYIAAGTGYDDDKVYLFLNNLPPTATIDSITPLSARFDDEITLSGTGADSDGTVVTYEWTSDIDGFLSDEVDFSITGFSVGNHTISFRVQDNDGEWSDWDTAVLVISNTPPAGAIGPTTPSLAEEGVSVSFTGTGSDSDGTIVAYRWRSSLDGDLSTKKDFTSDSLSRGTHIVTFQVQDNAGAWSDEDSRTLVVGIVPVAKAGDDTEVNPKTEVQFIGQGHNYYINDDGTIVNYEWDFDGDGVYDWSSTLNGITTHIYNSEGTYTAVLRVTDDDGFTATDSRVITVSKAGGDDGDDGLLPAPSLVTTMAAVAVMALRRRPE